MRAWIGTLSTAFNERLDQILVALLASEAVLGIYATAVNAFDVLLYLAAAAATAMVPLVARADPALRTVACSPRSAPWRSSRRSGSHSRRPPGRS